MAQFIEFLAEQWMLTAAFIVLSGLLIRSFVAPKLSGAKGVGVQEMLRMVNAETDPAVVLDVRTEAEFKNGHVTDSIHIPVGSLESRVRDLEKYRDRPIVINCQTGNRAMTAAQVLKKHGYPNLFILNGGMNAWVNANLPIDKGTKKKR